LGILQHLTYKNSRPEDIEEISDEEAEWSIDFDADFGDDVDDPVVKDFDFTSELKPLSYFSVRSESTVDDSGSVDDDFAGKVERIADLNSKPASSDWVELLEQVAIQSVVAQP